MSGKATFTPVFNAYRFYEDGTESGSTALAAENANITVNPDVLFHIRFRIQETGGADGGPNLYELQYNKNSSGTWVRVFSASSDIEGEPSSNLTNFGSTTQRLTSGSGSFIAGAVSSGGGGVNHSLTASNFTEHLVCLKADSADVADGDFFDFRISIDSGTPGMTNSVTPRVTVSVPSGTNYPQSVEVTADAVASVDRLPGKVISPLVSGGVSYARSVTRAIGFTIDATVANVKQAAKAVIGSAVATATVQAGRNYLATVSATVDGLASVARSPGKVVAALADGAMSMARAVGFGVGATADAVVSIPRSVTRLLSATALGTVATVNAVGFALGVGAVGTAAVEASKSFLVTVAATVDGIAALSRSTAKGIAATADGLAAFVRGAAKSVTASGAGTASTQTEFVSGGGEVFQVAVEATVSGASVVGTEFVEGEEQPPAPEPPFVSGGSLSGGYAYRPSERDVRRLIKLLFPKKKRKRITAKKGRGEPSPEDLVVSTLLGVEPVGGLLAEMPPKVAEAARMVVEYIPAVSYPDQAELDTLSRQAEVLMLLLQEMDEEDIEILALAA